MCQFFKEFYFIKKVCHHKKKQPQSMLNSGDPTMNKIFIGPQNFLKFVLIITLSLMATNGMSFSETATNDPSK